MPLPHGVRPANVSRHISRRGLSPLDHLVAVSRTPPTSKGSPHKTRQRHLRQPAIAPTTNTAIKAERHPVRTKAGSRPTASQDLSNTKAINTTAVISASTSGLTNRPDDAEPATGWKPKAWSMQSTEESKSPQPNP